MPRYQRILLATGEPSGDPGPLPPELVGLADETLADLQAHLDPDAASQLGYADAGFLPVPDPPPVPPRPELPKSVVTARVDALGKSADVWALFQAQPSLAFKWLSPDWPNVFCDDEGLLAALTYIGLTPEQIAEVVAI